MRMQGLFRFSYIFLPSFSCVTYSSLSPYETFQNIYIYICIYIYVYIYIIYISISIYYLYLSLSLYIYIYIYIYIVRVCDHEITHRSYAICWDKIYTKLYGPFLRVECNCLKAILNHYEETVYFLPVLSGTR